MGKSQPVQWIQRQFQRYPLLLILLLATLQLGLVLAFLHRQSVSSQSTPIVASGNRLTEGVSADRSLQKTIQSIGDPMVTGSDRATHLSGTPAPGLSASDPATQPSGKAATKTATKATPPPAQTANSAKPALTPEQQALNQQYKANFTSSAASVDALIEMRVAIAEGVPKAIVGSTKGLVVMDQSRNPLTTLAAGGYTVQPSSDGLQMNDSAVPTVTLIEPVEGGLLTLGDRTYRGRLLLVNDAGELWVVNLVNLRNYLHSVVASEVSPSWHSEALKAQAVAARSYALTYYFKPMSSLFHLGATEYYQVYSGIYREAPETSQAVDQTAGEFVSYRGGIVESLYAASDDIVAEAFRGQGMSQLGALNLAEQGYTYLQILANYYPSTGVSRIVTDYQ
ncbi:MAG: SpoIID/LytB domain-containing protein [Elainella sp. Prado103]|jgi:hypothetical protein|nr:SpoIID/LytB domain-containing protein [Elainella sp. Prado103]